MMGKKDYEEGKRQDRNIQSLMKELRKVDEKRVLSLFNKYKPSVKMSL